jgi:hypothetical protein
VGHENFVWWWSQETELVVRIGEQDAELEALRAREQQARRTPAVLSNQGVCP